MCSFTDVWARKWLRRGGRIRQCHSPLHKQDWRSAWSFTHCKIMWCDEKKTNGASQFLNCAPHTHHFVSILPFLTAWLLLLRNWGKGARKVKEKSAGGTEMKCICQIRPSKQLRWIHLLVTRSLVLLRIVINNYFVYLWFLKCTINALYQWWCTEARLGFFTTIILEI